MWIIFPVGDVSHWSSQDPESAKQYAKTVQKGSRAYDPVKFTYFQPV